MYDKKVISLSNFINYTIIANNLANWKSDRFDGCGGWGGGTDCSQHVHSIQNLLKKEELMNQSLSCSLYSEQL